MANDSTSIYNHFSHYLIISNKGLNSDLYFPELKELKIFIT